MERAYAFTEQVWRLHIIFDTNVSAGSSALQGVSAKSPRAQPFAHKSGSTLNVLLVSSMGMYLLQMIPTLEKLKALLWAYPWDGVKDIGTPTQPLTIPKLLVLKTGNLEPSRHFTSGSKSQTLLLHHWVHSSIKILFFYKIHNKHHFATKVVLTLSHAWRYYYFHCRAQRFFSPVAYKTYI